MISTAINQALLSRLPFMAALVVAVAAMGTDVYQFNRRNVGSYKIEPWLTKAEKAVRAFAENIVSAIAQAFTRPALVGAALLLLLVATGANADPLHLSGIALIGQVANADPTLADVQRAIEARNRDFEELKTSVLALKAGDPDQKAKIERIQKSLDELGDVNERFMSVKNVVDRLAAQGLTREGKFEDRELARRQMNLNLRAVAIAAGRTPVELDAKGFENYSQIFEKYLRVGEVRLTEIERRDMSVGTDPQGGYAVTPDTSGRMVKRLYETSEMRQYASVQGISTDALEGTVDIDEATAGWVSELGTRSADSTTPTTPTPWRIPVHEAYAQPKISQKNAEDAAYDIVGWHAKKTADKLNRLQNAAFVTGNGVGKPRGFASYTTAATADGSRSWGVFEHVATGSSGAFGTDPNITQKLISLIHATKDHIAAKGAFYMNRTTLGGLRATTDASSAGKFIYIPSFQAGMPDTLMGYPIRRLQDMATYSTASALAIAFGDMEEAYQIVDRLGISVLVDPYTSKPYILYYTRCRVGGDVLNFEALKFIKFA